jgi:cobalamin biosynthesis protein CobT
MHFEPEKDGNYVAVADKREKNDRINQFGQDYKADIKGIGATRANLGRMLRSLDLVGWSTREDSGRLNRKALTRYATGESNIFQRRAMKQADASAVTIMVDCSGSMYGTIDTAQEVSIQLAKMLEQAKVNYAVTGFTGSEPTDCYDEVTGTYIETVQFIPFKERKESLRKASPKMGSINRMSLAGNPDYSALVMCIEELSAQKEGRKILFFLTDTGSYGEDQMLHANALADAAGVTIIAIGIGTRNVHRLFKHGVNITYIGDMGDRTFNTMLKSLKAE